MIRYAEGFEVQQGHGVGTPLRLLPWQRRFLAGLFAPGVSEAAPSVGRANGATVRALSANPKGAHGLGAFSVCLLDEPSQWEANQSDAMYSVINASLGKQPGSRIAAIGTRPESDGHWFARLLDDDRPGRFRKCYSVPRSVPDSDCLTRRVWLRANPSAKRWPVLDRAIRKAAADARKDPRLARQFRALRCHQGLSDVARSHLLEAHEWERAGRSV